MYKYRNPITEVGPYSRVVPFNREFYVAESQILTSNDILEPLAGSEAAIANKVPIIGATTIYRLIGNGVNEPSFSSDFSSVTGYGYNKEVGAVNVIVMWFDGSSFLYKVLRETPTPEIPFLGKDQWVADFGLGADTLSLVINYFSYLGDIMPTGVLGQGRKRVSAFDFIRSVHYTGTEPIIYSISRDGGDSVENTDPKLAYVDYDCMDVGQLSTILVYAYVMDGPVSQPYFIQVMVQDTMLVCGPQ